MAVSANYRIGVSQFTFSLDQKGVITQIRGPSGSVHNAKKALITEIVY